MTGWGHVLLADADLRRIVIGRDVAAVAHETRDQVPALNDKESQRLAFFCDVFGQMTKGQVPDQVMRATARDVMDLWGRVPAAEVAKRLGPMLVRGASRVRAAVSAPTAVRHNAGPDDVVIAAERLPYANFFAIEEYDVAWRKFDGRMSETVTRAAFLSGDAVTVLPYDIARDRVLVVEQFRAGPLARGDGQCWQIEAIAGRVDPGEGPEQAARREAVEEAGLDLSDLLEVARYYPSPGAVSEYLYSYVALTDLPDGCAGVFGVEGEAEDIRGHLISFDQLMALVASGEIENSPLILTALWLQREKARWARQDGP